MSKFTPGKWVVKWTVRVTTDDDTDGTKSIAHVYRSPHSDNDALLIAAAPELYRELKHLVTVLDPALNDGKVQVPGLATLNAAWLAIAKADGK